MGFLRISLAAKGGRGRGMDEKARCPDLVHYLINNCQTVNPIDSLIDSFNHLINSYGGSPRWQALWVGTREIVIKVLR